MKLIEIMPSSLAIDPQVRAACEAIDAELEAIDKEIPQLAFWTHVDALTGKLLDHIMWEMHVDVHQMVLDGSPLTDDKKKELIDESILWHQKKGTKWIIEHALAVLFEHVEVVEWFEYGGRPYFFKVLVSSALEDPEMLQRVFQIIMELKNVRSWIEEFVIAKATRLPLWHAQTMIKNVTTRILMMVKPTIVEDNFYAGIALAISKVTHIFAPPNEPRFKKGKGK